MSGINELETYEEYVAAGGTMPFFAWEYRFRKSDIISYFDNESGRFCTPISQEESSLINREQYIKDSEKIGPVYNLTSSETSPLNKENHE